MDKIATSKTDKIKKILLKNAFPLFGLGALIWFLIRVIPKPSRAGYPCMKVAAPMASTFVLWLIGISATIFSFNQMKKAFSDSSPVRISLFLVFTVISVTFTLNQSSLESFAIDINSVEETVTPNNPIGDAKGIYPGRVVWVWNPNTTNENCTNTYSGANNTPADESDDGWFLSKNNNQESIDSVLSAGIINLTGENNDSLAWDSIFKYFNKKKHNNEIAYTDGEKIFIKINATSSWGRGQTWGNISNENEHMRNRYYGTAETSPHLILALLRQLVHKYKIPESSIYIADPMKHLYNNSYDLWFNEFNDVNYLANEGGAGRTQVVKTDEDIIHYSDKGNQMSSAIGDKIYKVMDEADYLINVPTMKAHARAGITLFAKNHFGSHSRSDATHLHPGLVAPDEGGAVRIDSNMYRVQVDLMAHKKFGGNQLLFLLDALWAGSEAVDPPTKWGIAPFNNDWTSSILLSQDPVAIESVAFDLLYSEYDGSDGKVDYPHMQGTTDYLRQAASSDYWPEGVIYDPENDGIPVESLGVNEHWNNPIERQYSRNLGTGNGIELVFIDQTIPTSVSNNVRQLLPNDVLLEQNYPNPFNPSTKIKYKLNEKSEIKFEIFDVNGRLVTNLYSGIKSSGEHIVSWNGKNNNGDKVSSGTYIYSLTTNNGVRSTVLSKKMLLIK